MQNQNQTNSFMSKNQITIKLIVIFMLSLFLLIPNVMITDLIVERMNRKSSVSNEIAKKWAKEQTVTGPLIRVPFKASYSNELHRFAYLSPTKLKVNSSMTPVKKKRGLFTVLVYESDVKFSGEFKQPDFSDLGHTASDLDWNNAEVIVNVSDLNGLSSEIQGNLDSSALSFHADASPYEQMPSAQVAKVAIDPTKDCKFNFNFKLHGTEQLQIIPVAKANEIHIASTWNSPSFIGKYLPNGYNVTQSGSNAEWNVLTQPHQVPRIWTGRCIDLNDLALGVKLIQPNDDYDKVMRSNKYAILFIALTFVFFFFIELLIRKPMHIVQYLLVGIALAIFYTLLLSLSEVLGFTWAYLCSTAAIISLIMLYVWGIFKRFKVAGIFGIITSLLYSYIYIILQLEDYALLVGSIGLLVILAIIMYVSQKINWFSPNKHIPSDSSNENQ